LENFNVEPYQEFGRYEAHEEQELENLPCCECCGEIIQQERAIHYEGSWICEDCELEFWNEIKEEYMEFVRRD